MRKLPRWARIRRSEIDEVSDQLDRIVDALGGLGEVTTALQDIDNTLLSIVDEMARASMRSAS